MAKWTDATIKALPTPGKHPKRHRKQSPDPPLKGFGIQVTPKGKRTFFVSYTSPTATDGEGNAKRRFFDLGTYPATTLAKAREKCREARAALEAGIDPMDARDADRQARRQAASRQNSVRSRTCSRCTSDTWRTRASDPLGRSVASTSAPLRR